MALVQPYFEVNEMFTVTPVSHKGPRRLLTSVKVNKLLHPILGNRLRDALEARGWGWTLMLRATKRKTPWSRQLLKLGGNFCCQANRSGRPGLPNPRHRHCRAFAAWHQSASRMVASPTKAVNVAMTAPLWRRSS